MTALKKYFKQFKKEMFEKLNKNQKEKGESWQDSPQNYLQTKLYEHYVLGHWVDVANFAFMLRSKEIQLENLKKQVANK
jgi:hypothetical protein